jgi:hypothetical protein
MISVTYLRLIVLPREPSLRQTLLFCMNPPSLTYDLEEVDGLDVPSTQGADDLPPNEMAGDEVSNTDPVAQAVVLPVPSYPSFYPDEMPPPSETQQLSDLAATFKTKDVKDWLTDELLFDIEKVFPSPRDYSYDTSGDKVFDLDAYRTKVGSFFLVGRVFTNYCQFCAAGKCILKSWAIEPTHTAKSLNCFYGQPFLHRSTATGARNVTPSLKVINCPFRIRYTFINSTTQISKCTQASSNHSGYP